MDRRIAIVALVGVVVFACFGSGSPVLATTSLHAVSFDTPMTWGLDSASTPHDFALTSTFVNMSCTSDSNCFSAGYGSADSSSNPYGNPFMEHWNGKTWSPSSLPGQVTDSDTLDGVDCYAPSKCWAVGGNEYYGANPTPILLAWDGSKWQTAAGAKLTGYISDLSCVGSTFCMGVGWDEGTKYAGHPIAEHWNGKTWAAVAVPTTSAYYTSLAAISCWSSSDCLAIGQEEQKGSYAASLFGECWDGKTWSIVHMPQPSLKGYQLYNDIEDLTCPTNQNCVAVGYYSPVPVLRGRSYYVPTLETWNGTAWSLVNLPKNESMVQPGDISCVSASACWVVGASIDPKTTGSSPAVAFWNGHQLINGNAADAGDSGMLDAVACASKKCFSLGYLQSGNGETWTVFAEHVATPPPDSISVVPEVFAGMTGTMLPSDPIAYFQDTAFLTSSKHYKVAVDWGDGSSTKDATVSSFYGLSQCGIFLVGCFKVSAKHTYKAHGTYTVNIHVRNTATGASASAYAIIQAVTKSEFLGPTFPPQVNIGVVDGISKKGTVENGCTATALHDVNVIVTAGHCGLENDKTIEFAPYHSGSCIHGTTEVSLQKCGGNPDGVFDVTASDIVNVQKGASGTDPDDVDVQFIVMPNKNGSRRFLDQAVPGLPALFNQSIETSWKVYGYPARDPKRNWTLKTCGPERGMAEYNVPAPEGGTAPVMVGLQPCAIGYNDIEPNKNRPYGGQSGGPFVTSSSAVPYAIGAIVLGECTSDGKVYGVSCEPLKVESNSPLTIGSLFEDGAMNAYMTAVLRSRNL